MAQMLGLAIWGGRVHQTQKEQQKVLNAQIIRKYEIENKKRAKASKPPLKVPEQPQTAKRTLWY
jgi:hypothetical protein